MDKTYNDPEVMKNISDNAFNILRVIKKNLNQY